MTPLAAMAVTLGGSNTIMNGALVDLHGKQQAWDFSATFAKNEGNGSFSFTFHNPSARGLSLDFGLTIREVTAFFSGGATFIFGDFSFNSAGLPAADNRSEAVFFAGGATKTLNISFGKVNEIGRGGTAYFDFGAAVATVPLPAAGALLLSALAGFGALRRRPRAS